MKIAFHQITSGSGRDIAETYAAYAKAGWTHFEVNFWETTSFVKENGAEALAKLAADNGLICVGATGISVRGFSGEEGDAKNESEIRSYAKAMNALGCSVLVIGGDTPDGGFARNENATEAGLATRDNLYRDQMQTYAATVGKMADIAGEYGVSLAMEVNWCGMCRSIRTMARMVEMVDRSNVGVVWDPAHFFSTPSRLADLSLLKGKIIHAHLNDFRDCVSEVMDINGDRVIPGEGILPLREWTDVVTDAGYDGYHCVELFSDDVWALPLEEIAKVVKEGCQKVWPEAIF